MIGENCGIKKGFFSTGIITVCLIADGNDSTVTKSDNVETENYRNKVLERQERMGT